MLNVSTPDHTEAVPAKADDGSVSATIQSLIGRDMIEAAARLAARVVNSSGFGDLLIYTVPGERRRAEDWLRTNIAAANKAAASAIHSITPETAQILLRRNDGNRTIDAAGLAIIMRDMLSGRWELNGEPIIVSREGMLNDGQHRCLGVVLTGVTIRSNVTFGVTRESMNTVNTGIRRRDKDRLKIAGETSHVLKSGIASFMFRIEHGRKPTPGEAIDYFFDHREEIEAGIKAGTGSTVKGLAPSVAAVASIKLLGIGADHDAIKLFFKKVRTGEMMKARNPAMVLHRALLVDKYKIKLSHENWLRAVINHFVAWARGKTMAAVDYTSDAPERV